MVTFVLIGFGTSFSMFNMPLSSFEAFFGWTLVCASFSWTAGMSGRAGRLSEKRVCCIWKEVYYNARMSKVQNSEIKMKSVISYLPGCPFNTRLEAPWCAVKTGEEDLGSDFFASPG